MKLRPIVAIASIFISTVAIAASTFTTHYNLEKPRDGDTGWGTAVRNDLDLIDTQLFVNSSAITDHINDTTDAHEASAIKADPGPSFCLFVNDVQAYLDCIDTKIASIPATSGTVTSVGLSMPSIFTVTGSPVSSSGTLTATLNDQPAGVVLSGPSSGADAGPTFRALVASDIPAIDASKITSGQGSISSSTTGVSVGNGANSTVGPNVTVDVQTASASQPGLLSSSDFTTFNNKQDALTPGSVSTSTTGVTVTNGANATVGPNTTINIDTADATHTGLLSAADWVQFNAGSGGGISELNGLTDSTQSFATGTSGSDFNISSSSATHTFNIPTASAVNRGALSSSDWTAFNNKQNAITAGNISTSTTGVTVTNGSGSTVGPNTAINIDTADSTHTGLLSASDYVAFSTGVGAWKLTGNSGTNVGSNYIGTSDAQDLRIKTNTFDQFYFKNDGGWYTQQSRPIGVDTTYDAYLLRTYADMPADTGTSNVANFTSDIIVDNANTGSSGTGAYRSSNTLFTHNGDGTLNFVSNADNAMNFASSAGKTDLVKGINLDVNVASGYEIDSMIGLMSNVNSTGGKFGGLTGATHSINLTDAELDNSYGLNSTISFNGTTAATGAHSIHSGVISMNDSASSNSVYGTLMGINMSGTSTTNGIEAYNSNIQISQNASTDGMNAQNFGTSCTDDASCGYINGININNQIRNNATATNVSGINVGTGFSDDAQLLSYSAFNTNPAMGGNTDIENVNLVAVNGNIEDDTHIDNFTQIYANTNVRDNATVTNAQGLNVNLNFEDSASSTNGLVGASIQVHSDVPTSQAKGVQIDLSDVSLTTTQLEVGSKKIGLGINDGSIEAGYNYTIPNGAEFLQNHFIGGSISVANGTPASAFGFGMNLAQSIILHDDWTVDGAGLGFNAVGFVGSLEFDSGKTLYSWTGALSGAGNPSGAGTITNAQMYRAAGVLPQGGSLAVTNMKGFEAWSPLCGTATNCWGFYDDANAENYLSKLAVGTSSKKVTSGTLLDVDGVTQSKQVQLPHISTPSNPPSGSVKIYSKSDDKVYKLTSGGTESEIGGGALVVSGSRGTPTAITAGGGITSTTDPRVLMFIEGSGGPVDVTANPQISAGTTVGQEMILMGRSDTNTVLFENGNGLELNGSANLGESDSLTLIWDGTVWVETSRNF